MLLQLGVEILRYHGHGVRVIAAPVTKRQYQNYGMRRGTAREW
jgi:hypothetical protein